MSEHNIMQWEEEYKIHSYESDITGKASLPSICDYMQETAWVHAENLGVGFSHLSEKKILWVLTRQFVRMNKYPRWGDTITVCTWPTGMDKLLCYRDFKILNSKKEILGLGTSSWLIIDVEKRRPQKTENYIDLGVPQDVERALERNAAKIEVVSSISNSRKTNVSWTDMDVNGHVNNVKYIEYIINSLSIEFLKQHSIAELEINFINEVQQKDTVVINNTELINNTMYHSLVRESDNCEICRARTEWTDFFNFIEN